MKVLQLCEILKHLSTLIILSPGAGVGGGRAASRCGSCSTNMMALLCGSAPQHWFSLNFFVQLEHVL
jgi:hypothetical protein